MFCLNWRQKLSILSWSPASTKFKLRNLSLGFRFRGAASKLGERKKVDPWGACYVPAAVLGAFLSLNVFNPAETLHFTDEEAEVWEKCLPVS